MAAVSLKRSRPIEYPKSDGKPIAETDYHRDLMVDLIRTLQRWFDRKKTYVSGNLLMYYEPGNNRKRVAPDVFVVPGVSKKERIYYLTWEEGKNPALVIELTSALTRREDTKKKYALYRDVLKVKEYFLFDPLGDYLKPRLQRHLLRDGEYMPIALKDGRIKSKILGLHLEPAKHELRLYDPDAGQWLTTFSELVEQATARDEHAPPGADDWTARAESEMARADEFEREHARLVAENERQRRLIEKLIRQKKNKH